MKRNIYFSLVLLFVIIVSTTGCVSSEENEETVKAPVATEVKLPKSPFYSGFSLYAFVQDSSLIKKITAKILKNVNIDITLFGNLIRKIYVNKIDDNFLVFIEARFDSLVSKKNILRVSSMQAMGVDGRLWSLSEPEYGMLYFDMQYKNVVAITNIDPELYLHLLFDWQLNDAIKDIVDPESGFWIHGKLDFTDKFLFDSGFSPEWGFITSNGYDAAGYLLTTVAIPYSGLRKDLATIKIILPAILDNFDVRENTSLPFITSVDTTMIIKGIHISPKKIDEYMAYITNFSYN